MPQSKIIVVGAGIIGINVALALQSRGYDVTVLDREGIGAEASKGNAGAFAFTDIVPLATPDVMRRAPKWLMDPMGPLSIPPSYALKILPWMMRFWRASWRDQYERSVSAQSGLMTLSRAALERQIAEVNGEPLMHRDGQLQLFEGEADFRASLPLWQLRKAHGIRFDLLKQPEEIAEIQPGIALRFTHAGFTPDWINTCDPQKWVQHLADLFAARGGMFERANITALAQHGEEVHLTTSVGVRKADHVVLSAGAWSHNLARTLGDCIPLETERGYNTTLPTGAFDLRTHLTFGGHGFVVSRIDDGIRVGGAVELGGLKIPPNYKRSQVLLDKAAQFMPSLNPTGGTQWMGFRPSMPDSLPVIGKSPGANRVVYAFGHGHLGLTQAAGTAELVRDIISRNTTQLNLAPFAPDRF